MLNKCGEQVQQCQRTKTGGIFKIAEENIYVETIRATCNIQLHQISAANVKQRRCFNEQQQRQLRTIPRNVKASLEHNQTTVAAVAALQRQLNYGI